MKRVFMAAPGRGQASRRTVSAAVRYEDVEALRTPPDPAFAGARSRMMWQRVGARPCLDERTSGQETLRRRLVVSTFWRSASQEKRRFNRPSLGFAAVKRTDRLTSEFRSRRRAGVARGTSAFSMASRQCEPPLVPVLQPFEHLAQHPIHGCGCEIQRQRLIGGRDDFLRTTQQLGDRDHRHQ